MIIIIIYWLILLRETFHNLDAPSKMIDQLDDI